jgi:hypothetical protein
MAKIFQFQNLYAYDTSLKKIQIERGYVKN